MMNIVQDLEYEPDKEGPVEKKAPDIEAGFIPDENEFYKPGSSERRDEWGDVVSHQDSKSFPGKNGLNNY